MAETIFLRTTQKSQETKLHILFTGYTPSGKLSSTVHARARYFGDKGYSQGINFISYDV